jgi:1-acyl-sn-glycerol-3-phosphate acyltransferase
VAVVAPHTSNLDFVLFLSLCLSLGLRPHFIGKHTLFKWPLGIVMRLCGGIPVDRTRSEHLVDQIIAEYYKVFQGKHRERQSPVRLAP